ncbi:TPA: hypothetical protein ACH3X2_001216 [Trebouxia sp. C0005]
MQSRSPVHFVQLLRTAIGLDESRCMACMLQRSTLFSKAPFSQQLAEYKVVRSKPIRLDRPGYAHSSCTWQNSEKHILCCLGPCHFCDQVSVPTMQLSLCNTLIW